MDRVRELERALIKVEGALCVVLVLVMLLLAGYNVLYRNVLVPLQTKLAHSGPPITATDTPTDEPEAPAVAPGSADAPKKSEAGGFGGAFGAGADEEDDLGEEDDPFAEPDAKADGADGDEDSGFGGAFGEDEDEAKDGSEDEDSGFAGAFGKDDPDEEDDGFGGAFGKDDADDENASEDEDGFGGAFGKPADDASEENEDDFFVEDEFDNLPEISAAGSDADNDGEPEGGPPPEGSLAAWGVDFIDVIKLDWIDVFTRQVVIIVSFLGAAVATRRQKHINIDALSRLLKANGRRIVAILTNMLAVAVCLVLANSGAKLVSIGLEYPRELVPFADQWMFQLMFPIGFGLLSFHFGVRLLEAAKGIDPVDPAEIAAKGPESPKPAEDEAPAERESDEDEESGPGENEDDPAHERTDVGEDSEETAPGEVDEAPHQDGASQDESLDEDEEEGAR